MESRLDQIKLPALVVVIFNSASMLVCFAFLALPV